MDSYEVCILYGTSPIETDQYIYLPNAALKWFHIKNGVIMKIKRYKVL